MTWKTVANNHFGSSHIFGGNDIDKISRLFSGIEDVDIADINTNWPIRDDKFKLRNPANTASYIYSTSAIPADRTITEPVMSFTSDKPVYENATQILSNKSFFNSPWPDDVTVIGLADLIGDTNVKRWGMFYPAPTGTTNSTIGKLSGILSAHSPIGNVTPQAGYDSSTQRLYAQFASNTSPGEHGLLGDLNIGTFRTSHAGKIKAVLSIDESVYCRFGIGLTTWTTPPTYTYLGPFDPLLGAGFGAGFMITNEGAVNPAFWGLTTSDNSGTATRITASSPLVNNRLYTLELEWSAGGSSVTATIDGTPLTASTDLPSSSTNLFFHVIGQNRSPDTGPLQRNCRIASIYVESE